MITLRWKKFPGADVTYYKVYCSILGFKAPIVEPDHLAGKTLILVMNSGTEQTITFDGTTSVVELLNSHLLGAHTYILESDPGYFYLRSDIRSAPGSVRIVGGTAISDFGLVARTIYEKSEDFAIAMVPAPADPDEIVQYEDPDGVCQDWYTVTTISGQGAESLKSPYRQPVTHSGNLCVLEGIVTDLQGVRIPDAEVTAALVKFPHESSKASQITIAPITTRTGPDGRFSLAVLQGALVQVDIPSVEFHRNITVPYKACEFITDILVDLDYRYPVEYGP